ncbi:MAG: GGDEF domain-containing protein [Pseudomonadota bacterium]
MSLVAKIMGNNNANAGKGTKAGRGGSKGATSIADGALDTLSNVIHVMGTESFPLENDIDPMIFPEMCTEFAAHVENGAGVPSFDIPASVDGSREWAHVRRFFSDRRKAEREFVTERLHDYRGVVEDLVSGLRNIGERDHDTEISVKKSLNVIEDAVGTGVLPEIRKALAGTIRTVTETFDEQRKAYERELEELNDRMSNLRQDLVAAREEMKRDALTDAYNRGAFDSAIGQSLNMHFILNQPVTVMMIDIDKFKEVNDTFGHAAGDEVLRGVGEALARSFIRKSDLVARFGGDEFAVILNDTSAGNCTSLLERFLKLVTEVRIPYASEETRVSCSVGYTEIHSQDSVESLMHRADKALYKAKENGRNQAAFIAYDDMPPASEA